MASLEDIYQAIGRMEAGQAETNRRLENLESDVGELKGHVNRGKGFLAGIGLAAGGAGAAIASAFHKLFGNGS